MFTIRQKTLFVSFALLLAQAGAMSLSARTSDHPTWQEGLALLTKSPELKANVTVDAAIQAHPQQGIAAAQKLLDAAEFLLKAGQVEISEPFFREAWVKAELSKGASDEQLEKFAARYANVVLNEKAGSRSLYYARSAAETSKRFLDEAKVWDETAKKREAAGQTDIKMPKSAPAARETAASYREQAKPSIAEQAKYRKEAAQHVAEAAKSDLWSRVFNHGKNGYVYDRNFYLSQDLLTMFVNHTVRTTGGDPDIADAFRELAKMKLKQNDSAQAIAYYKKAIAVAVRSWRPDSSEALAYIGEFQEAFPEEAGSVPGILADAKKVVDAYNQAAKVEKIKLKPGETKKISSHVSLIMNTRAPTGLQIDSATASATAAMTEFPLRKSATLYDEGQRIKVTYRGGRSKTVFECYKSSLPIDSDFDIERSKVAAPKIELKPIRRVLQDGTPDFFINGTIPSYKLSSNPLVTVFYTDKVLNASGRRVCFITNYGITEQSNPDNVGDVSVAKVGPLSITIKRLPNKSKYLMNPIYEATIKQVSAPTEPRILSITY